MEKKRVGQRSIQFLKPPHVAASASVVGKKEGEGPLHTYFDRIDETDLFGGQSWEDAESSMQRQAAELAIQKAGYETEDMHYILAGDLLGQLIASSFGIAQTNIPFLGIYGACSTMGEGLLVSSMLVEAGFAERTVNVTSSHFASAEKEFRFPLGYGNQRPLAATWTVTGSGAVVLISEEEAQKRKQNIKQKNLQKGKKEVYISQKNEIQSNKNQEMDLGCSYEDNTWGKGRDVLITGATVGKIVDYGVKDKSNMGACMAPAAADTIAAHLRDFKRKPQDYDKIITGDLGAVGKEILLQLLQEQGFDATKVHEDCGMLIYDNEWQDTHSGGSGCGCSAATFASYLLNELREGTWSRILFVPTGALLSPVSSNEGRTIPGIAHAVVVESR